MDTTVFYVEDDPNDVFLMERVFKKYAPDLNLKVFSNGADANAFFSRNFDLPAHSPDMPALILLDINLPGQSGLEILQEIRNKTAFQYVPVVMFTSSNQAIDIARAYERGCSGFVVKPQGTETLKEVVSRLTGFWLVDNHYPPAKV